MEDISSLFNYRDPRSMRADQYSAQMQAPSGNLDQMTVQLGGNAGSLIGNALFGGRTSKMAEQAVLNEAIKESEVATDPDERLSLFAQALRKRGLEGYAQKVDAQLQGRMKAKTDAQNAQQKQMSLTKLVMDKTGLDPDQAAALAQDEAAVRELMKTETTVVETAKGQVLVDKNTGREIKNLGPAPDRRNITNVNVSNTAENEYAKKVGAGVAERDLTYLDTTTATAKTLPKIEETLKLINSGQINTGLAKDMQDGIAKVRAQVLKDKAAGKNVSDSEYLDSLLGSDTFAQIPLLGLGAKGMDTPAERDFILSVITGQRSLSLDTLRRMTEFRRDAALRQVGDYNQRLSSGEFDQYQSTTGRKLKPIEVPGAPSKPAAPSSVRSAADAILQGK